MFHRIRRLLDSQSSVIATFLVSVFPTGSALVLLLWIVTYIQSAVSNKGECNEAV